MCGFWMNLFRSPKVARYEDKFLISSFDLRGLQRDLKLLLLPDINNAGGDQAYEIQNLYFDNLADSDLVNKIDGNFFRQKLRLRVYNGDVSTARLELKVKANRFSGKFSRDLNCAEFENAVNGDFSFLKYENSDLSHHLARNITVLRPVSAVFYKRFAFYLPFDRIRVTLDSNIYGGSIGLSEFPLDRATGLFRLTPQNIDVVEVKYQKEIPVVIKDILSRYRLTRAAVSKYALSRYSNEFGPYNDRPYLHF